MSADLCQFGRHCLKIVIIALKFVRKALTGKVLLHLEIIIQSGYAKKYSFISFYFFIDHAFCLSISYQVNKIIKTNISASPDFVWNVSLVYAFNRKYIKL